MQFDYAQYAIYVAVAAGMIGTLVVNYAINSMKAQSPIIVILTVILFLSLTSMPFLTWYKIKLLNAAGGSLFGVEMVCTVPEVE